MKPLLRTITLVLGLLFSANLSAQFTDQFTDGDFTQNPVWNGDTGDFEVIAQQLHLLSSGADTSVLYTAVSSLGEQEWNAWFRLSFAPSDNNYVRIYLASDQQNLKGTLNGYFLRYGENGAADGLDLWRQDGNSLVKIIDGASNPNASSTSQLIRVKVIRSLLGNWELLVDYSGGYFFQSLGTVSDLTYTNALAMGVWCKYTSSNSTGFYFDDFYQGPLVIDTQGPEVSGLTAISTDTILVSFSEPVDGATATNTGNFTIQGIGNPSFVIYSTSAPQQVKLVLPSPLLSAQAYAVQVQNITDFSANEMLPFVGNVMYYTPSAFDLLISEIMADPDPQAGLPTEEYVEIYNRMPFPVSLTNWKFQVGNTIRSIPSATVPADSFIVLMGTAIPPLYSVLNVVGISSFPNLTNAGTTLRLLAPDSTLIHELTYSSDWYQDPVKEDGGWSLEMINPTDFCNGIRNWSVCQNFVGGTPGGRNSVFQDEIQPFKIQKVVCTNANTLDITLSQFPEMPISASLFSINKGIGMPDSVVLLNDSTCRLYTAIPFLQGESYVLTVSNQWVNCAQELVEGMLEWPFSYFVAQQNAIIITEIMPDEEPSQGLPLFEYIELYNRSPVPISLNNWKLGVGNSSVPIPDFTLASGAYVILSKIEAAPDFSGSFLGLPTFPSLTNAGTTLRLINNEAYQVFSITYKDTWIEESYKRTGGWSLEMKDVQNPCGGSENWGASVHPDGGTPGQPNSIQSLVSDTIGPYPIRLGILAEDSVIIYFSEKLNQQIETNKFYITNGIGQPTAIILEEPNQTCVLLKLGNILYPNILYELQIADSIRDCVGNKIRTVTKMPFSLPEFPSASDIIINEVLFDPRENGEDYIELYNRSAHAIDLQDIHIGEYDSLLHQMETVLVLADRSALLMPGEYILFSKNKKTVFTQYNTENSSAFWDISSMPSLSNSGGSIAVCDNNFNILDAFTFTDDFHFSLLNNKDGVSLERINSQSATQNRYNWTSASFSVNYGTPGYKNSQWGMPADQDGAISLSPEVFSPDQDGFDDVLFIQYEFPSPGNVLTLSVYNENGQLVKKLLNNAYCGISGQFTWDGGTDNGIRPKIGVYVLIAEWFNELGEKGRAKKVFTLATKL